MLKSAIATAFITSTLLAAGCTSMPSQDQQAKNISLLQNKNWVLTYIGATEYKANAASRTVPNIQFGSDLRVSGTDGCNRLMGLYAIKGEHISLGQFASSKMLCKDMQLSNNYNEALNKVTAYQVYDKTLKLLDKHGNRLLQYTTTTP